MSAPSNNQTSNGRSRLRSAEPAGSTSAQPQHIRARTYYLASIGSAGAAVAIALLAEVLPESLLESLVLMLAFTAGTMCLLFLFLGLSTTLTVRPERGSSAEMVAPPQGGPASSTGSDDRPAPPQQAA